MRPVTIITDGASAIMEASIGPCPIGCFVDAMTLLVDGQQGNFSSNPDPVLHVGFAVDGPPAPVAFASTIDVWQAGVRLWTPPSGLVFSSPVVFRFDFPVDERLQPSERFIRLAWNAITGFPIVSALTIWASIRRAVRRDI